MQYTAGKNIPLTDYLSRHPIIHEHETETPHEGDESEAEEEFVINQIYGLFEFNRTNGSITQHMRRPPPVKNSDQSERRTQVRKQNNREHSIQTFSPQKDIDSPNNSNFDSQAPKMSKMDRVNGIDLQFIFKKRGHSPETSRLRTERFSLLQPNRTRIVGKGKDNERILEYRPSQQDRKEIEKLNILIYNRFFYHCEKLGTTPLREFNENLHES